MTSFMEIAANVLGQNPYDVPYEEVVHAASSLRPAGQTEILRACDTAIRDASARREEAQRVSLARVLVALVPASLHMIEHALDRKQSRWDYELHFSLFCYVDRVQWEPRLAPFKPELLHAVEQYLIEIKRKTALAGWMAGDLLGAHWAPSESAVVLQRAFAQAVSVQGRRSALHGLEELLMRDDVREDLRSEVKEFLQKSLEWKSSRWLREEVEVVLREAAGSVTV